MPIPIVYRKSSEAAVASFDYTDIAEGTGVTMFNGFVTEASGAVLGYHLLKSETIYSSKIETESSSYTSGSDYTSRINLSFDLPAFNLPKTLKGNANVLFTLWNKCVAAGTSTDAYVKVTIQKWDGTTPTDIVQAMSPATNAAGAGVTVKKIMNIPLAIPMTSFKKGEILRLNLNVFAKVPASTEGQVCIGHDPLNRDGTNIVPSTDDPDTITKLLFYCPFVIDL